MTKNKKFQFLSQICSVVLEDMDKRHYCMCCGNWFLLKDFRIATLISEYDEVGLYQDARCPTIIQGKECNGSSEYWVEEEIFLFYENEENKEIFNERVTKLLKKYKSVFNKEIEASYEPEEHYKMTLNQIDNIFTGVLPKQEFIQIEYYWFCLFYYKDLYEIKEYYKNCIMSGVEVDYSFINSPTQRQGEIPQITAHALYLFRKWVEKKLKRKQKK